VIICVIQKKELHFHEAPLSVVPQGLEPWTLWLWVRCKTRYYNAL